MLKGCERMANKSFTMEIKDLQKVIDEFGNIDKNGRKAVEATVKDVRARAPSWVAQEITNVYNTKKPEITPSTKKDKESGVKKAGDIKVRGDVIEHMQIVYTGRRLTPVHFGMTPKTPTKGRKYTLTMQVYKGQKEVIGRYETKRKPNGPYAEKSHNILMHTGNRQAGGTNYIPFQRMSRRRTDLKKFLTTSVPQMVGNEEVYAATEKRLHDELEKRLEHNIKRFVEK